jgi:hypothetical protein
MARRSAFAELSSSALQGHHLEGSALLSDYWALTKPEVNFLILITTFVGFYLASAAEGRFSFAGLFNTLLGTLLITSGTGALNPIRRTEVRRTNAPNRPASSRDRPSQTVCSLSLRNCIGSDWRHLSRNSGQPARECARHFDVADLSFRVHPAEAKNTVVRSRGSFSGCDAAAHWLGRSLGPIEYRGLDTLRHAVSLAVSTFHGNRMDVPRRLRPRGLSGSAQGQYQSSFRDLGNSIATCCSSRHQCHAISGPVPSDFLLCSHASRRRIRVLRLEICVRAIAGHCTPAAESLDYLSSIAVRLKRDIMQSRAMLTIHLPADRTRRPRMSVSRFPPGSKAFLAVLRCAAELPPFSQLPSLGESSLT